jgi:hypothetical protein
VTFLRRLTRRRFVHEGAVAAGALMLPPGIANAAGARTSRRPRITEGPYGPLAPADPVTGVQVPEGFKVREIAHAGVNVGTTPYTYPSFPDGSGSIPQSDGSWIFVVNSEIPAGLGGVSAIHFSPDGSIRDAYRICSGTSTNCGGGTTPWGTWLTGEEVDRGRVVECDPLGKKPPVPRPAMGLFSHEYILSHDERRVFYLTEDESGGGFYRFKPTRWGDLSEGLLEIATLAPSGKILWTEVPDPLAASVPTRDQVKGASKMKRPEGLCIDQRTGIVFFAESSAGRIIAYDPLTGVYELIYGEDDFDDPILTDTDNVAVSPSTGDLFICEDAGTFDVCILTPEGEMAKFAHLAGPQHGENSTDASSETTGPSFDPSGTRFYFSSQRAGVTGATYEVTGPWRTRPSRTIVPRPQKVRFTSKRRIGRKRLRRTGLPVEITLDTMSTVVVELRARTARGKHVVVGRAEGKDLKPGAAKLVVRASRRVPGEKVTLLVTVTEKVGRRAVARRRIELT